VIVNPVAGRGGIRGAIPHIREVFAARGVTAFVETTTPGEEKSLAEAAIADGATTIVAVGGDGTCSGIANAILQSRAPCRLALIPLGTGNDFAKTLGVSDYSPEMIADLVTNGRETRIDVGIADGRHFLNSCGFGFDAAVLDASNRVRFLKGDAVYIYTAITKLFTYRGTDVSVRGVAGIEDGPMLMVTVSNGRSLGGAFKIAPTASVLDGKLDVCFFRDAGVIERVQLFAGAMRGTHPGMRAVSAAKTQLLTLTFGANPAMEVDGELGMAESTSVEITVAPSALAVLAAPGALV
jgi:diacylglycerol kinase (ATP)